MSLPLFSIYLFQLSFDLLGSILIWIGIILLILLAIGGYLVYAYAKSNMRSRWAFMTSVTADRSIPDEFDIHNGTISFPKTCPYCKIQLDFSKIIWVTGKSGKCHNCEALIDAE